MLSLSSRPGWISRIADQWVRPWWRIVHLGALLLALATLPSTYRREARPALARHLVGATLPMLPWFTLLAALATLVIVRIVLVTALSYGLSQYALEMVVRVLALELIPLTAMAGWPRCAARAWMCCAPRCCRAPWPASLRWCCWRR